MSSRKRSASDPLSSPRSPKQRRLSLEIDNKTPEPKTLLRRWYEMIVNIKDLSADTLTEAFSALSISIFSSSAPSTPFLVDETNTPISPASSSLVATPQQTPSPQRKPDVSCSSTPKQDPGLSIQPPPIKSPEVGTWTLEDPLLDDDTFQIFEDAKFSTPKAHPGRSSSSDRWTTPKDPPPTDIFNINVTPSTETQQLPNSCDTSIRESELSSSSTLISVPKSGSRTSKKSAKRGHQWRPEKRKHIYEDVHKARVLHERRAFKEEITQRIYERKQQQGYKAPYRVFKGWLAYKELVEDTFVSSSSLGPSASIELQSGARKHGNTTEFLIRAFEKYDATMKGPKPPVPNIPSLGDLEKRRRAREEEIDRQLRPPPLPSSLAPEEEKQVSELLRQRGVVSKFAREQVSDQDISRLRPGQWLNDEIINFYGAMILARSEASKENPAPSSVKGKGKTKMKAPLNVHYFSSFFWTKLTQEGYDKGRLAKWTKKIDIFSKDAIIMPVNHGNAHWTAASINFRQRRFESYDSMNMAKARVFQVLRSYVNSEHMNKKNKPFNFDGWQDWAPETTPQQENGYDCGVFTCQFLETLSRGEDFFNFSQADMYYLRKRMIWEIGNAKLYDSR